MRSRAAESLLFLLTVAIALPPATYRAEQVIAPPFALVDRSWQMELPTRLRDGEWAGRDFVYNYGPLYQILHAAGYYLPPGDLPSFLRWQHFPARALTMLSLWLALGLTGAPLAWRGAVCLVWSLIWAAPEDLVGGEFKPMALALPIMLAGRTLLSRHPAGLVATWSVTPIVALLYSFDLGLVSALSLCLLAFGAGIGSLGIATKMAQRARRNAAIGTLALTLALGATAVALSQSGFHAYLEDSWHVVTAYSAMMTIPLTPFLLACLVVLGLVGLGAVFIVGVRMRAALAREGAEAGTLLGIWAWALFALVWQRYALTRSDPLHVWIAALPTLFLITALIPALPGIFGTWSVARWLSPAALMVPAILFPSPRAAWRERWERWNGEFQQSPGLRVDHAALERAANWARDCSNAFVYPWPWESIAVVLGNKRNPAYTVQSFATDEHLELRTIQRLETTPDLAALIFREGRQGGIDGVTSWSRSPLLFLYLLTHFELARPPHPHFALLQRSDPDRRKWRMVDLPLPPGGVSFTPSDQGGLSLPLPKGAVRASDLIVLRLKVDKTASLGLFKPGVLVAALTLANGTRVVEPIKVPQDGAVHTRILGFQTLADDQLFSAFVAGRWWRARECVAQLELVWTPLDSLSIRPARVTLERLSIPIRAEVEELTTSILDDPKDRARSWTFGGGARPGD